MLKAN